MTGFAALNLPDEGQDTYDESRWAGVARIIGPKWAHLPAITVGLLGVQIFWSVEMSYASPYLLSLGLSKSNMAIVFLAGPLSGLIMQPLIGVLADSSTSRWGRRRPYMLVGTVLCTFAMLLLGFTRSFASIFTEKDSHANDLLTIWLAVLSIYFIDFSINAVQAVDRALLVDTLPSSDQASGNAWAARMLGVGSVVGFFVGNINLPSLFPFFGSGQLQVLSFVSSLLLLVMHGITAACVQERRLLSIDREGGKLGRGNALVQEIKDIFANMLTLPRIIQQICFIQFFAWMGWFPILFYTSLYVGDFHKLAHVATLPPISSPDYARAKADLDTEATRLGSRALFFSSVLSLVANIVLPYFVAEANGDGDDRTPSRRGGWYEQLVGGFVRSLRNVKVHLTSLWAFSHLLFALCMAGTFFASGVFSASLLMTITGLSWAVTQWAPFSLLAEAILTESADDSASIRLADTRSRRLLEGMENEREANERQLFLANDSDNEGDDEEEDRTTERKLEERRRAFLGNGRAQVSHLNVSEATDILHNTGGLSAKAGIILGIHNIFIVIPQFLVTGLSSIIFAIFDPEKSVLHGAHPGNTLNNGTSTTLSQSLSTRDGDVDNSLVTGSNSVAIIFRIGGISAAMAFILCWRLARELRHR